MSKFNTIQSSFVSGMVSSKFNGATSLQLYNESVEELINMVPTSEGGARSREAFQKAINSNLSDFVNPSVCALIPYIDSKNQCYIFKITYDSSGADETYFKVYKFNGSSWTVDTMTGIYAGLFSSPPKFDWCYVGDAIIITSGENVPWIIYRPMNYFTTFYISPLDRYIIDSNLFATQTDLNKKMQAMSYPMLSANTNPNQRLVATVVSGSTYTLSFKNAAGSTLATPWTDGLITYILVTNSTYTALFKTTGVLTGDSMTAELIYSYGTIGAVLTTTGEIPFYVSAWDNKNGYPKYCTYTNGRLVLAGTDKFPSKAWLSAADKIYRFHNITYTEDSSSDVSGIGTKNDTTSDGSFSVTTGGSTSSKISWVVSGPSGFYVGKFSGVDLLTSGNNGSFVATNIYATTLTNEGASNVKPVVISGSIIYISVDGKRVILLTSDGKTTDLTTLFSDYLYKDSIYGYYDYLKRIIVDESSSTVYVLSNKGLIFGFRLNSIQSKWGIFKFEIPFLEDSLGISLSDICIAYENSRPTMFLNTEFKNTQNSYNGGIYKLRFTAENLTKSRETGTFDCWNAISIVNDKTFTLPTELQYGKYTLGVYYRADDGHYYYEKFETGDYTTSITLSRGAEVYAEISCGFIFRQRIKSLDLDFGGTDGSAALTLMKRIDELNMKVWASDSLEFGVSDDKLESIQFSDPSSATLYTGLVSKKLASSPQREVQIIIQNTNPTPLYISCLVFRGLTVE